MNKRGPPSREDLKHPRRNVVLTPRQRSSPRDLSADEQRLWSALVVGLPANTKPEHLDDFTTLVRLCAIRDQELAKLKQQGAILQWRSGRYVINPLCKALDILNKSIAVLKARLRLVPSSTGRKDRSGGAIAETFPAIDEAAAIERGIAQARECRRRINGNGATHEDERE